MNLLRVDELTILNLDGLLAAQWDLKQENLRIRMSDGGFSTHSAGEGEKIWNYLSEKCDEV